MIYLITTLLKRKLREEYNPRIQQVNDEILDVKGKIGDLKVGLVETGVDRP